MGHDHNHHHSTENIKVAFWLNFIFTIIEIIGGFYTNSIAILADALHDLGDTIALAIAWFLDRYSKKKRDNRYSYGYGRFSLLAAFINGMILMVGSIFILYEAIPRLLNPIQPNATGMIWLALGGIFFNGIAVMKLRSGKSQNEKVVSWHLMEDVLGWIAVLLGSIIMKFWNVPIIDAMLSVGVTIYILYNVLKNLVATTRIFLQAKPENINEKEFVEKALQLPQIKSIHDTHLWSIDGERVVFTLHVVVDQSLSTNEIIKLKKSIRNLGQNQSISHMTVEIEYKNENCALENC